MTKSDLRIGQLHMDLKDLYLSQKIKYSHGKNHKSTFNKFPCLNHFFLSFINTKRNVNIFKPSFVLSLPLSLEHVI